MITIDPKNTSVPEVHHTMLGSIGPRPIAFASTIDKEGKINLSPFSFFNAFGANPATLVFSPSRRGRDNTTKNTFDNIKEIPEVVINVVTYSMVEQASLASTEYPKGVNEFIKAGFTAIPSEVIRPPRVKESPVQMECKVMNIIETGNMGGAGNLVICEILKIHLNEDIFDSNGSIDPHKIDLVGRLGGDFYCRASGEAVFTVEKPLQKLGIGIDQLPDKIKNSKLLTGNDLGKLGNLENLPSADDIKTFKKEFSENLSAEIKKENIVLTSKEFLAKNEVERALLLLMSYL
ncbi:MAG: flavin reductase family protein [Bacteroidales bacterium]|nr:flavin reductase family protein [Bacteroidales bacterium]MCF8403814.1 flavin reductase family protein [Bacteroidales bacterium]